VPQQMWTDLENTRDSDVDILLGQLIALLGTIDAFDHNIWTRMPTAHSQDAYDVLIRDGYIAFPLIYYGQCLGDHECG